MEGNQVFNKIPDEINVFKMHDDILEIKSEIKNIKTNDLCHLKADLMNLKQWMEKLDERVWLLLATVIGGFVISIAIYILTK